MLNSKMEEALNKQIEKEAFASNLYLAMASWCEHQSMDGCAEFLYRQADEERMHMMRIFRYISEMDSKAITPSIPQPPLSFDNVQKLFEQVYEHEKEVTASIHSLIDLAYKHEDYATLNFLQWYVDEQREEESLMRTILDRIKLIGDGPQSLYYIDKELRAINKETQSEADI